MLITMSAIGAFCFLERVIFLHKSSIKRANFTSGLFNLVEKGRIVEALTVCQENPSPVSHVMRAGLLEFRESSERVAASMREVALLQVPLLERRVSALNWIAKTAPLVGLLGTLIPILQSFLFLESQGPYPSSDVLIGEVGEALVTTVAGVFVAIMAMSSWYWVDSRMRAILQDIELAGAELLQFKAQVTLAGSEAGESK